MTRIYKYLIILCYCLAFAWLLYWDLGGGVAGTVSAIIFLIVVMFLMIIGGVGQKDVSNTLLLDFCFIASNLISQLYTLLYQPFVIHNRWYNKVYSCVNNNKLHISYLTLADPLEDTKCKKCSYFPICDCGCTFNRMKNITYRQKIDVCLVQKQKLDKFLSLYYSHKINRI